MSRPRRTTGPANTAVRKNLPSPAPRHPGSPARKGRGKEAAPARARSKTAAPGPGTWVVVYLRDPREKAFGMLLDMEAAGGWFRGIELGSFEDWAREIASGREAAMGLSTFFVPFLRVEKIVADEPVGLVPSLAQLFQAITGRSLEECLG